MITVIIKYYLFTVSLSLVADRRWSSSSFFAHAEPLTTDADCRVQVQQAPVSANGNGSGQDSSPQDLWLTGTNKVAGANPDGDWSFNGNICIGHLASVDNVELNGANGDKGHILTAKPTRDAELFINTAGLMGEDYDGYPIVDLDGTTQVIPEDDYLCPYLSFDPDYFPDGNFEYPLRHGDTFWSAMELEVVNLIIPFFGL